MIMTPLLLHIPPILNPSICWCRNLEVLEANDNYLEKLPAKLGDMKALKLLRQETRLRRYVATKTLEQKALRSRDAE